MENEKKLKFNPDDMIAAADEQLKFIRRKTDYGERKETEIQPRRYDRGSR